MPFRASQTSVSPAREVKRRESRTAKKMLHVLLMLALGASPALAGWNAQARTPPQSWRSWSQYGCNVSQPDIVANARGLADMSRLVDGVPTSLAMLGYVTAGLDDCYQELLDPSCVYPGFGEAQQYVVEVAGSVAAPPKGPPYTQHDDNGRPAINRTRFPDLLQLTTEIHALGLQAGWYQNNCEFLKRKREFEKGVA